MRALQARGAWSAREWRTIAHVQADPEVIDRQVEELHARAPSALYEYRLAPRQQNPPAHLHVPATVAQLGTVLDLTTQSDAMRTTWERADVGGLLMCCDPDAMDRKAGSAAIYLLRPMQKEANPERSDPRAYSLTFANLKEPGTLAEVVERVQEDQADIRSDDVIDALRELQATRLIVLESGSYRRTSPEEFRQGRRRGRFQNHHDGDQADAGATYEAWHEREPERVTELDELPDVIGVYIGRAQRIGYSSDKWKKRGKPVDYDHDYTEPGYEAPEVWADRLDLARAHAIVIIGGNQRITPEGID
jgi:hypothetical protein